MFTWEWLRPCRKNVQRAQAKLANARLATQRQARVTLATRNDCTMRNMSWSIQEMQEQKSRKQRHSQKIHSHRAATVTTTSRTQIIILNASVANAKAVLPRNIKNPRVHKDRLLFWTLLPKQLPKILAFIKIYPGGHAQLLLTILYQCACANRKLWVMHMQNEL